MQHLYHAVSLRLTQIFSFSVPSIPPSNVVAITIAPTSVNVSWDQLPSVSGNSYIAHEVRYSWPMGNGQLGTMYVNTSGESNQLVLHSLQECVQYNISVRAYTSQGPGLFSSSVLDSSLNSESSIVIRVHITSNPFYHDPQCMLKFHNHQKFRPVHSWLPLPILPGAVLWKRSTQSSHTL